MNRRIAIFVGLFVASWCVMTVTHEVGHLIGGWSCGGTLVHADLRPWHLPQSRFQPDPIPLVTLWSGPIFGVLIPLAVAIAIGKDWSWFISNFATLANGTYIAAAWLTGDRFLDAAMLLDHGSHPAWLALFCIATIGPGYVGFRRSCIRLFARSESVHKVDGDP